MFSNLKVETGLQLLSRIIRKQGIEKFYPILFETGPKQGDTIELFSDTTTSSLLLDMISDLFLVGHETSILILSTDGHLNVENIEACFRKKLTTRMHFNTDKSDNDVDIEGIISIALQRLVFIETFDSTQFYITIQNLENVLVEHSNISMIIIDTLTAFYWSEQTFKLTKMDLYLKMLLKMIHKVTKDFKVTILYTRPAYFCSTKEMISNLEPCTEHQNSEQLNYRIQIKHTSNLTYDVIVRTHENQITRQFILCDGFISWLKTK